MSMAANKKLRIAMIASECVPYSKTGGLADVVGALPVVLSNLGHEVIVIIPKYSFVDYIRYGLQPFISTLGVWMGNIEEWCSVHKCENDGVPVYFIESNKYFDRWGLYHDADFNDYQDNPRRFGLLTRAGLQLCRNMGFSPDIVHVHDWQTALASAYLKIWHWNDPLLGQAASLLTLHNIAYQGVYHASHYDYLGLQRNNFSPEKFEDHGQINILKGGIYYADMVNTVSPSFARETCTPEGGHGLAGKQQCKHELQRRFLLDVDPHIPVIGIVSRLAGQKGLGLLAQVIERIVSNMLVQFVILGAGDKGLEYYFGQLPGRYPGKIGSYIGYNEQLSHWIEAGSDFFLMPSLYEPCGLNQIYSLKYGTLPVVRATGGLDDTVQQYDEKNGTGTGFKFWEPSAQALYFTVGWAVSTYFDRQEHIQQMIRVAMAQDFSWEHSARQYQALYERAIANKRNS
jgi:starch synthase